MTGKFPSTDDSCDGCCAELDSDYYSLRRPGIIQRVPRVREASTSEART